MPDEKVVTILNISDSMQIIDSYSKKRLLGFYHILFLINNNSNLSFLIILFAQLLLFFQFISLSSALANINDDWLIQLLQGLSNGFLWHKMINTTFTYIVSIISLSMILIVIIILIAIIKKKANDTHSIRFRTSVTIISEFNEFLLNYLIGPIVYICLLCTHCKNDKIHFLLNVQCYNAWSHIVILILSFLCLISYIVYSVIIAIYGNEIGSITERKFTLRLNCNYELYVLIARLILFIIFSYLQSLLKKIAFVWLYQCAIFLIILIFIQYSNYTVVYYDRRITLLHLYGWNFCGWFTFILILREILTINDITIFILIGYIIIIPLIYKYHDNKRDSILTELNIFDTKNIKEIELFISYTHKLIESYTIQDRCLLNGIIKRNEEWFNSNSQELNEKYYQLLSNDFLKKKYMNQNEAIKIMSIITIIYEHHLNKSNMKSDIMLIYSYFLINYMNNPVYAMILCSKLKVSKHKYCYLKYILMEQIKQRINKKFQRSNNRDSLKYVALSDVILYNYLIDEFKLKIFDAACLQIDYFESIRNKSKTTNSTNITNFLKMSRDIMTLRNDLGKNWEDIVQLNPFCHEIYKDYMMYLEVILKDQEYAEKVMKDYTQNKVHKESNVNEMKMYNSLFNKDISSVMLIDGYSSSKSKILYSTSNAAMLYGYFIKELLNMTIDDLLPNTLKHFHNDIMLNAINNSQLYNIYLKDKNAFIKVKTGGIAHVSLFIKTLPNMSYGLIFIMSLKKITQDDSMVLFLSDDYIINDISDMTSFSTKGNSQSNYGINIDLCGNHIASVLPEVLLQMNYAIKDSRMEMKELEIDLKGRVYQSNSAMIKELNSKALKMIEMIKQYSSINIDDDNDQVANKDDYCVSDTNDILMEYNSFVNHMNRQVLYSFSVFYRLNKRSFAVGKKLYVYYRLYITNDLLTQQIEEIARSDIMIRCPNNNNQSMLGSNINITGTPKSCARQKSSNILKGRTFQSIKQIRIKVSVNNGDNEKGLLLNDLNDNKEENPPNEPPLESRIESYHPPLSFFLKIKHNIINNKVIFPMLYIRLIILFYLLLTLINGFMMYYQRYRIFNNIMIFLNQNQFFDNTKVIAGSYYLLVINFQMHKYNFIKSTSCHIPCHELYLKLYNEDIDLLQEINDETMFFIEEFKQILNLQVNVTLTAIELNKPFVISINYEIMINLIISTANSFLGDVKTNLNSSQIKTDDIHANNFLNILWAYFTNMKYNGLDVEPKKEKMTENQFEISQIPLMINTTLLAIVIALIIWEVYVINMMETEFIKKIIFFQDSQFEVYLKGLEELKRRLKNENGNDDDSNNNQMISQSDTHNNGLGGDRNDDENDDENDDDGDENNEAKLQSKNKNNLKESAISSRKDNAMIQRNKLNDMTGNNKNDQVNIKPKKKISKRAYRHKLSKAQQCKNDKVSEMTLYFYKSNIFFFIKLFIFLVITLLYYIIFKYLHSSHKENYLFTDQIMASIETVYKSSYITFLMIKSQTYSYVKFELEKEKGLIAFDNGASSYTIGRITYFSKEELINASMIIIIPNNYVTIPKMGNQILPLLKYSNKNNNDIKTLTELYNGDCCKIILGDDLLHYNECATFWSGIMTKGIEQAMIHMGVVFDTVFDELKEVNEKEKPFSYLFEPGSSFWSLEYFLDFYLMYAYNISHHAFATLRKTKHDDIAYFFTGMLNTFIVCVILIYSIILFFISREEKRIRDFYNLITIWPYQYIASDEMFYEQIIQLGKVFYYIQP